MAGRGGFKGPSTSLRPEQLQGMGIMGKDMPSSIVAPPPTYPPLISRLTNDFKIKNEMKMILLNCFNLF